MQPLVRWSCVLIVVLFAAVSADAQSADLVVTKSAPALSPIGSVVPFVVTVANNGPDAAVNVVLTDVIPDDMTFATLSQDNGPAFLCTNPSPGQPGTVTCTIAAFPASSSAQFTFGFDMDDDVLPGTPFENTASVTSNTPDPNGANNSDSATTTTPAADLAVIKTGPATANAGDDVSYVVTVTNIGPQDAANVTITDLVPPEVSFVSATHTGGTAGSCTVDVMIPPNGLVTCTVALLPNGASSQFTLVFTISDEAPPGTQVTNVASATTSTGDPNMENNSSSVNTSTPPPPVADLALNKSAPVNAGPGTQVDFTIVLMSGGPDAAADVTVTDTLPGNLTFNSIQQSGVMLNCTTPGIGAGGTITCTAASYPAGGSTTITIRADIPAQAAGEYVNTAVVTSDNDFNDENNVSTTTVIVTAVDVTAVKSGPGSVNAGSNIIYTIVVENAGPDTAFEPTFTDAIPAGTTFVSFTPNSGPPANCTMPSPGGGGTIACQFQLLPPGQPASFTLTVNATGSTASVTNTAVADAPNNFDTDPDNDTSTVVTTVVPFADLAVFKSGPGTVTAGTNVSYTVTVANTGPSAAANVVLTDATPANTTFVSATQTSGPAFNCTGTLSCSIASLPAGSTATFVLVYNVSPSATGSISNTADVASPTADPDSGDRTANVLSTVAFSADLGVTKTGPASWPAGSNITYNVTARNFGPSDASTVTLTDLVPANTTYVSAMQTSGPAFTCDTTITCTIATFPAGTTATFTFVVNIQPAATGSITNTASIDSPTPDPATGNDSATVVTTIAPAADLSVTKSGPAAVTAGATVTYTVTAMNAGPSTATNVTLTDQLPPMTTFVSATQDSGPAFVCGQAAGTITCTTPTFAPLATATFTFVFDTDPAISGAFDNTAQIASQTSDPNNADNTDTATTAVDPGPTDLSITKTAGVQQTGFGGPVTYTITVTNNGPSTAFGTTVTDVLPAGTTFESATPSQGNCTGTTTVVCNLGTLAPSSSATISLVVRMPSTPGTVTNTATVSAANAETDPDDNAGAAAVAVTAEIPTLSTYMLLLFAMVLAGVVLMARMQ
jgi:uncharacterized repeat protein (TIGR01451 family)